jgi:hypothetical protein
MRALAERRTTQRLVAEQLGLTVRQVERLYARFKADGAHGLVSRKRGGRGNRTLPPELRKLAIELVRGRYADFGPALAHEKLRELHQIHVSVSTVRSVYIDDATSRLMELRFVRSESTFDYFESTHDYLRRHGKPVAFYSDKASIFRVNAKDAKAGDGFTQFGRAMFELNIDTIFANSPAAKGRVERAPPNAARPPGEGASPA